MRHPSVLAVVALAALAVGSCQREMSAPMSPAAAPAEEVALRQASEGGQDQSAAAPGSAPRIADAGRKLVKTVDLELRVADTTGTADRLRELTTTLGGYVSAVSAERRGELLYYRLTLRVPVDRLEEAIRQAKALADRVESESIRTEDVTERWVDLQARLKTLRATETELLALLTEARQRKQDVEDVMKVYTKLTEIRTAIEQLQGEQQALASLVSLSTLNVELVPTEGARPLVAEGWSPGGTLRRSFRTLVQAVQGLADVAIVLLVVGVPLALVIVAPIWLLVRLWRRARRRTAAAD